MTEVPARIARNFQSDVTAELTSWIGAQPDGTTIEVPAGARYRIDGTVVIRGKRNLTLTCPTGIKPVFSGEAVEGIRERAQWFLDRCEGVRFHRIRTEGSNRSYMYNVSLEGQSAWWIAGSKRVELDQCEAEWTYGDFVQVQGGTIKDVGHAPAEDIWIHSCTSRHIGRIVLVTNNVRRVVFERNRCYENRRSVWDAEPNFLDQIVEDIFIQDNTIGPNAGAHFEAGGGKPTTTPIGWFVVQRNTFIGTYPTLTMGLANVPVAQRRHHVYWVGNTSNVESAVPQCLALKDTDFILVRNNHQKLDRDYLNLNRCCGWDTASVRHNDVSRADGKTIGIYRIQQPCNVKPVPSPAPASVHVIPAVWPFPR